MFIFNRVVRNMAVIFDKQIFFCNILVKSRTVKGFSALRKFPFLQMATSSGEASLPSDKPADSKKGDDAGHGNRFQSKLLVLYSLRAINKGYDFYLGTELPDQGAKFDDLVFKYRKQGNEEIDSSSWSYQYLQAKHRLKETSETNITQGDLLRTKQKKNKNLDFSAPKYFRSFLELSRRGDTIENCIICTNVDIDQKLVGQTLQIGATPKMLDLEGFVKESSGKPACYKLKNTTELRNQLKGHSISHVLAEKLRECVTQNKPLNVEDEKFRNYHMALILEHVIDLQTKKFHQDFTDEVKSNQLSGGAKELRRILVGPVNDRSWKNWTFKIIDRFGVTGVEPEKFNYSLPVAVTDDEINDFFEKFIIAANTPNEGELNDILKIEVTNYFKLLNCEFLFPYIFQELEKEFNDKKNIWILSQKGREILETVREMWEIVDHVNKISIDYQDALTQLLEFDSAAIDTVSNILEPLLLDSSDNGIKWISTQSPKLTAIKVISAIKRCPNYECRDSYLVVTSSRFENAEQNEKIIKTLENKYSHQLLVVVCDDRSNLEVIGSDNDGHLYSESKSNSLKGKKIIVIGKDNKTGLQLLLEDKITYKQLSEEAKNYLKSKTVSFQGICATVEKLLRSSDFNGIDSIEFPSILEELLKQPGIVIPSPDLPKEHIELENLSNDDSVAFAKDSLSIKEKDLFNKEEKTVVIFGRPGSGKSFLLSKLYESIKIRNPECWVILIDLANYSETLADKFPAEDEDSDEDGKRKITFFVEYFVASTRDSPFARWLLKHRLETSGGVVLMFDGLDKISRSILDVDKADKALKNAIQLLQFFSQWNNKLDQLFVTSLWDNYNKLSEQLNNFFEHEMEMLNEEQQIHCVTSLLQEHRNGNCYDLTKKKFQEKLRLLIQHIANTLEDGEEDRSGFLGVPLHCKILAEWFSSIDSDSSKLFMNMSTFDMTIFGFYKYFIETKALSSNHPVKNTKSDAYDHYYNLSNDTVFADENEDIKKLLRISHGGVSPSKKKEREHFSIKCGLEFGLTYITRTNTVKFLHKSLAEFVLAHHLHLGFHLEDKEQAELLEKQPIRDLIVKNILNAREKYKTVRMFLNFMLEDVVWKREWRNIIIQNGTNASGAENNQSNSNSIAIKRLQQFVKAFRRTRENEYNVILHAPEYEALDVAADEKNATIFVLLLDCIEAMHKRTTEKVKDGGGLPATFEYYPSDQNDGDEISFGCKMDDEGYPVKAAVERFLSRFFKAVRIEQPLNGETEQINQCFLQYICEQFDEDEEEAYVAEKEINNQNNQGLKIILHAN